MQQILIGGLVTLAGTLIVQLFVVPRMQARTRGRERWEKDVEQLAALLEEELPRAHDGYRWAGYQLRYLRELAEGREPARDEFAEFVQGVETEVREANRVVGEQMARLKILIARVRRLHPDAPFWRELDISRMRLSFSMFDFERPDDAEQMSVEQWEDAWVKVVAARERMLTMVNTLANAHPPKPPPRQRIRRTRQKVEHRIRNRRTRQQPSETVSA